MVVEIIAALIAVFIVGFTLGMLLGHWRGRLIGQTEVYVEQAAWLVEHDRKFHGG